MVGSLVRIKKEKVDDIVTNYTNGTNSEHVQVKTEPREWDEVLNEPANPYKAEYERLPCGKFLKLMVLNDTLQFSANIRPNTRVTRNSK